MGECYIHHLGSVFVDYALTGRIQRTLGNRHQWLTPHNCYPAKGDDRWINIAVSSDEEWRALRRVMGDPDWAKDPRYATCLGRLRHCEEMDRNIAAWTKERDRFEVQERLQQAGVAAYVVTDVADQYRDPQLRYRDYFRRITHPESGEHEYPFQFWKVSDTPWEVRHTAPLLGEDNPYIYRDLLGVTEGRYKEMEATGHIGMDYAPHIP
jgi:benzylsuccinate CoA-transferase BbsF subunit